MLSTSVAKDIFFLQRFKSQTVLFRFLCSLNRHEMKFHPICIKQGRGHQLTSSVPISTFEKHLSHLSAVKTRKQDHCVTIHEGSIPVSRNFVRNCFVFSTHYVVPQHLFKEKNRLISGARHYCSLPPRFSVWSPEFASFLESLSDEYRTLSEGQAASDHSKPSKNQERAHRLQFLHTAEGSIEQVQLKKAEILELEQMLEGEEEAEMKALMVKEKQDLHRQLTQLEAELLHILAGEDPAHQDNAVLEVTAGVGGQEAMLFCAEIFSMYCNYVLYKGWNITNMFTDDNDLGGSRKASMEVTGSEVYKYLKHEGGVHRVQRVPKTEKSGRMHTSTITVSVLPQPKQINIDLQPQDLKVETFRNSGPGGQSVNTTDSAVRITHLPTGTVAEGREEKSQLRNRDIAMKKLATRMYQAQLEEEDNKRRTIRKMQMGTRARSEKIRTYNFQQDRVTDHRVKATCSNLDQFMSGSVNLDELLEVLIQDEKEQVVDSMLEAFLDKTQSKRDNS